MDEPFFYFTYMKKYLPLLFIGGIGAAAYFLYNRVQNSLSLIPDFVGIDVKFNGLVPYIQMRVRIVNTSGVPLIVQAINGNFYFNGQYVGRANTYATINIPANGETIAVVKVEASVMGFVTEIMRYINGDKYMLTANFVFDGAITAMGVTVPFKLSYKLV